MVSCNNSDRVTEAALIQARDTLHFDIQKAELAYDNNALRNRSAAGVEYGIIFFQNKDTVKYWFLSHHLTEGSGGTLFELPDGQTEFISGYFCCEVQLPNDGNYPNANAFMEAMRDVDGLVP